MARKWFSHFKEVRFDISDMSHSGRPLRFDEDHLNTLLHNDPYQCAQQLADVMNCDHSTIMRHLHSLGKVKLGVWGLYALNKNHKNQWVAICASLLVINWLMNNIDHSYLVSLLVTRTGVFMLA